MNVDPKHDGLHQALESMLTLESALDRRITEALDMTKGNLEAPALIAGLQALVARHQEGLETHRQELGETNVPAVASVTVGFEVPALPGQGERGVIESIRSLASAFGEAALSYAVLHAVAHRSYHVATADLADEHRRDYLAAAHTIHAVVGDVVVQELLRSGQTCRCECPACAPGICLCWHVHVDQEQSAGTLPTTGIVLRRPRQGSNAEHAGMRDGDVILKVADRAVNTYQDMLDRMREHEPGAEVPLLVRRDGGEEVVLIRR